MEGNMSDGQKKRVIFTAAGLFALLGWFIGFLIFSSDDWYLSQSEAMISSLTLAFVGGAIGLMFAVIASLIGGQAERKGRSWAQFFWLSMLITPLLTWLIVATIQSDGTHTGETRKCPACAELIKAEARVCKHCSTAVEPLVQDSPSTSASANDPLSYTSITGSKKVLSEQQVRRALVVNIVVSIVFVVLGGLSTIYFGFNFTAGAFFFAAIMNVITIPVNLKKLRIAQGRTRNEM